MTVNHLFGETNFCVSLPHITAVPLETKLHIRKFDLNVYLQNLKLMPGDIQIILFHKGPLREPVCI